jgi:glycosyltransferase involved in cell wall biosynthesis
MARSIVVWGGPPYFGPANSPQEEMSRAFRALGNDVLYVELEGDASHYRREARMNPGPVGGTASSAEGVLVARAPKLPFAPYAMMGPLLSVHMGMAAKQLKSLEPIWQDNNVTMLLYGWFSARLAGAFAGTKYVYDCIDEHRAADGVEGNRGRADYVWREETKLLEEADLTVCVSETLAEDRAALAKKLIVQPNATDIAWCRGTFREPEKIVEVPRPRALLMGRITSKMDIDLVRAAARADTSIRWIVAGEWADVAPVDLPPNILALGKTHHDDMAALAAHCDCGVAPLKANAWNRASWPMKFCDYLASGLPIVSTRIPAAEKLAAGLPDGVLIAEAAEEFARAIRTAAGASKEVREGCRKRAASHTWKDRAQALLDALASSGGAE